MDKHISLALELGFEGQELRDYLKRQQDLEREVRLAQSEYEREKSPIHFPGGPKRKVQILGVPSFHTLTNIRIRWIVI